MGEPDLESEKEEGELSDDSDAETRPSPREETRFPTLATAVPDHARIRSDFLTWRKYSDRMHENARRSAVYRSERRYENLAEELDSSDQRGFLDKNIARPAPYSKQRSRDENDPFREMLRTHKTVQRITSIESEKSKLEAKSRRSRSSDERQPVKGKLPSKSPLKMIGLTLIEELRFRALQSTSAQHKAKLTGSQAAVLNPTTGPELSPRRTPERERDGKLNDPWTAAIPESSRSGTRSISVRRSTWSQESVTGAQQTHGESTRLFGPDITQRCQPCEPPIPQPPIPPVPGNADVTSTGCPQDNAANSDGESAGGSDMSLDSDDPDTAAADIVVIEAKLDAEEPSPPIYRIDAGNAAVTPTEKRTLTIDVDQENSLDFSINEIEDDKTGEASDESTESAVIEVVDITTPLADTIGEADPLAYLTVSSDKGDFKDSVLVIAASSPIPSPIRPFMQTSLSNTTDSKMSRPQRLKSVKTGRTRSTPPQTPQDRCDASTDKLLESSLNKQSAKKEADRLRQEALASLFRLRKQQPESKLNEKSSDVIKQTAANGVTSPRHGTQPQPDTNLGLNLKPLSSSRSCPKLSSRTTTLRSHSPSSPTNPARLRVDSPHSSPSRSMLSSSKQSTLSLYGKPPVNSVIVDLSVKDSSDEDSSSSALAEYFASITERKRRRIPAKAQVKHSNSPLARITNNVSAASNTPKVVKHLNPEKQAQYRSLKDKLSSLTSLEKKSNTLKQMNVSLKRALTKTHNTSRASIPPSPTTSTVSKLLLSAAKSPAIKSFKSHSGQQADSKTFKSPSPVDAIGMTLRALRLKSETVTTEQSAHTVKKAEKTDPESPAGSKPSGNNSRNGKTKTKRTRRRSQKVEVRPVGAEDCQPNTAESAQVLPALLNLFGLPCKLILQNGAVAIDTQVDIETFCQHFPIHDDSARLKIDRCKEHERLLKRSKKEVEKLSKEMGTRKMKIDALLHTINHLDPSHPKRRPLQESLADERQDLKAAEVRLSIYRRKVNHLQSLKAVDESPTTLTACAHKAIQSPSRMLLEKSADPETAPRLVRVPMTGSGASDVSSIVTIKPKAVEEYIPSSSDESPTSAQNCYKPTPIYKPTPATGSDILNIKPQQNDIKAQKNKALEAAMKIKLRQKMIKRQAEVAKCSGEAISVQTLNDIVNKVNTVPAKIVAQDSKQTKPSRRWDNPSSAKPSNIVQATGNQSKPSNSGQATGNQSKQMIRTAGKVQEKGIAAQHPAALDGSSTVAELSTAVKLDKYQTINKSADKLAAPDSQIEGVKQTVKSPQQQNTTSIQVSSPKLVHQPPKQASTPKLHQSLKTVSNLSSTSVKEGSPSPASVKEGNPPPTSVKEGNSLLTSVKKDNLSPASVKDGNPPPTSVKEGNPSPASVKEGNPPPTSVKEGNRSPASVKEGNPSPASVKESNPSPASGREGTSNLKLDPSSTASVQVVKTSSSKQVSSGHSSPTKAASSVESNLTVPQNKKMEVITKPSSEHELLVSAFPKPQESYNEPKICKPITAGPRRQAPESSPSNPKVSKPQGATNSTVTTGKVEIVVTDEKTHPPPSFEKPMGLDVQPHGDESTISAKNEFVDNPDLQEVENNSSSDKRLNEQPPPDTQNVQDGVLSTSTCSTRTTSSTSRSSTSGNSSLDSTMPKLTSPPTLLVLSQTSTVKTLSKRRLTRSECSSSSVSINTAHLSEDKIAVPPIKMDSPAAPLRRKRKSLLDQASPFTKMLKTDGEVYSHEADITHKSVETATSEAEISHISNEDLISKCPVNTSLLFNTDLKEILSRLKAERQYSQVPRRFSQPKGLVQLSADPQPDPSVPISSIPPRHNLKLIPAKYDTPLKVFRTHRLKVTLTSPEIQRFNPYSLTYAHRLDPTRQLCSFDLHGSCHDPRCPNQHLSECVPKTLDDALDRLIQDAGVERARENILHQAHLTRSPDYIKFIHGIIAIRQALQMPYNNYIVFPFDLPGPSRVNDQPQTETKVPLDTIKIKEIDEHVALLDKVKGGGVTDDIIAMSDSRYYYDNGDNIAVHQLEQAVEDNPHDVTSWSRLVYKCLRDVKPFSLALQHSIHVISLALEKNPGSEKLWLSYIELARASAFPLEEINQLCETAISKQPTLESSYRLFIEFLLTLPSVLSQKVACQEVYAVIPIEDIYPADCLMGTKAARSFALLQWLVYGTSLDAMSSSESPEDFPLVSYSQPELMQHLTDADCVHAAMLVIHVRQARVLPLNLCDGSTLRDPGKAIWRWKLFQDRAIAETQLMEILMATSTRAHSSPSLKEHLEPTIYKLVEEILRCNPESSVVDILTTAWPQILNVELTVTILKVQASLLRRQHLTQTIASFKKKMRDPLSARVCYHLIKWQYCSTWDVVSSLYHRLYLNISGMGLAEMIKAEERILMPDRCDLRGLNPKRKLQTNLVFDYEDNVTYLWLIYIEHQLNSKRCQAHLFEMCVNESFERMLESIPKSSVETLRTGYSRFLEYKRAKVSSGSEAIHGLQASMKKSLNAVPTKFTNVHGVVYHDYSFHEQEIMKLHELLITVDGLAYLKKSCQIYPSSVPLIIAIVEVCLSTHPLPREVLDDIVKSVSTSRIYDEAFYLFLLQTMMESNLYVQGLQVLTRALQLLPFSLKLWYKRLEIVMLLQLPKSLLDEDYQRFKVTDLQLPESLTNSINCYKPTC